MTIGGHKVDLEPLGERCDQILSYHWVRPDHVPQGEIISHFTKWDACQNMLGSVTNGLVLWAGDATCLNDPLEGKPLLMFAENAIECVERLSKLPKTQQFSRSPPYISGKWPRAPWDATQIDGGPHNDHPYVSMEKWFRLDEILTSIYSPPRPRISGTTEPFQVPSKPVHLVSFCRDADRLDLWRAYGGDGTGVCLVMPLAPAVRMLDSRDWRFYRVSYDERAMVRAWALLIDPLEQAYAAALRESDEDNRIQCLRDVRQKISPLLYLFKHDEFGTEREIRLIYRGEELADVERGDPPRAVIRTPAFFLNAPGSRVILGPKSPHRNNRAAAASALVKRVFPRSTPTVEVSRVPYQ